YTLDNVAPVTPALDQDGQSLTSSMPTLTGSAEANVTVTVNIGGHDYVTQADASGHWTVAITDSLANSDFVVTVTSEDQAGNDSQYVGSLTINIGLDSDQDGIADLVEGRGDFDHDGIPNYLDDDSDNDGIADRVEGNIDSDGDGAPDYLDLDSDNDGLGDARECASGVPCPDSDSDGLADYRDADDDGDGVSTVDEDRNGNGDPSDDDTDGDGSPDYLDSDDDGDGLLTANEGAGDSDGDSVPNYLDYRAPDSRAAAPQPPRGAIHTGMHGAGGSSSVFMLGLLMLAGLLRRGGLALLVLLLPGLSQAGVIGNLYGGAGAGVSRLKPDVADAGYRLDDNNDRSWAIIAGYQLLPHVAGELFYTDLGAASLKARVSGIPATNAVDYSFWGGSGLYYLKGYEPQERGLDGFLRVGLGGLQSDAGGNTRTDQNHDIQLYFGAGGEWRFAHGWATRAELQFYDKDASQLLLSLLKRFGQQPQPAPQRGESVESVAVTAPQAVIMPADADQDGVVDGEDRCPATPAATKVDEQGCALIADSDGDGVADNSDICPHTPRGTPVDERGCDQGFLRDSREILFASNSFQLTNAGRQALARLSRRLADNQLALIIEAHTDSLGNADYNQALSEKRAAAVVEALINDGIDAGRLTARGMGESQPVADNRTAAGRLQNRRVEFRVNRNGQQ
ncbi:MAG: OmpA family protein, partial [Alcanivorax sp.]|nr:OmpA family protein [Alcanivorax sp.]